MINIPPIKPSTVMKSELISNVVETWKVGQVLNATTQTGGEALSKVLIRLGEHTLEAKTPVKLETGQEIKLLVKAVNDSQAGKLPLLSILPPNNPTAMDKSQVANFKLRQFIAIQSSFASTQQTAQSLLENKQISRLIPKELFAQLSKLQNGLLIKPEQGKASSQQLKQLVENSGIFLESKLKTSSSLKTSLDNAVSNDFKNILLNTKLLLSNSALTGSPFTADNLKLTPEINNTIQQLMQSSSGNLNALANSLISILPKPLLHQIVLLLTSSTANTPITAQAQTVTDIVMQSLRNTPAAQQKVNELSTLLQAKLLLLDLALQVDRSLSQITSFQLQPLSRDVDTLTLLLFNLVLKDKSESTDINFKIEQEENDAENDANNWRVTLIFNFKTLGKIQSHIHLKNKQVSTIFQCEKETTSDTICEQRSLLEKNLQQAGFEVTGMLIKTSPVENSMVIHTHSHTHLLDENI